MNDKLTCVKCGHNNLGNIFNDPPQPSDQFRCIQLVRGQFCGCNCEFPDLEAVEGAPERIWEQADWPKLKKCLIFAIPDQGVYMDVARQIEGLIQAAFHRGVDAAKDAIRTEGMVADDSYYKAVFINTIARKCGFYDLTHSVPQEWQPMTTALRDATPILVALITDGKVWRVSDAKFYGVGFYTVHGGNSCHWATHWMPLPAPPRGDE